MGWTHQHDPECPVTRDRRNLLIKLAEARKAGDETLVRALEGAGIEYDNGGDQEVECCTCFLRHRLNQEGGGA